MSVHVTLHVSEQVSVAEVWADDKPVTLTGGQVVLASAVSVGQILEDGREVLAVHSPAGPA